MKIADSHAHIFPSKIANKAVQSIGNFYNSEMQHNGLADDLIKSGSKINVDKYLVCSSATTPNQVEIINDFIYDECVKHEEFIGLGTLHPDYQNMDEAIEKIINYNLKGIKLHPDFQKFNIDDEKAIKMYKKLADAKLPILFHTGDKRYDASSPERMGKVAKMIPELKCIAAHFGGYNHWYDVLDYLRMNNVMFDTSSTLFALDVKKATEMIKELGENKFLFGSDFPMWDHEEELGRFSKLPLAEEERKKILWDNFAELFKVEDK